VKVGGGKGGPLNRPWVANAREKRGLIMGEVEKNRNRKEEVERPTGPQQSKKKGESQRKEGPRSTLPGKKKGVPVVDRKCTGTVGWRGVTGKKKKKKRLRMGNIIKIRALVNQSGKVPNLSSW